MLGPFPRMIATATRPGLLESDGPAHMEETGGGAEPCRTFIQWRPKTWPDTTQPPRRSAKPLSSCVAVGIATDALHMAGANLQHNGFVPPLVANLALHPCNASAQPNNALGMRLRNCDALTRHTLTTL